MKISRRKIDMCMTMDIRGIIESCKYSIYLSPFSPSLPLREQYNSNAYTIIFHCFMHLVLLDQNSLSSIVVSLDGHF